jgi:hypothetical protein
MTTMRDEMIVYWFTKLFSIIIQNKRNDQLFEEFQLTSNELQHESHEKQLQLDRLLLEAYKTLISKAIALSKRKRDKLRRRIT